MKFKRIYVEICNTCNLSCSFCTYHNEEPRRLQKEQFAQILAQVRFYTSYLYLHVLGEPLMHPQLDAILEMCHEAGMHVQLTTNGTLLKQRLTLLQRFPPRQINISVHSFWEQPSVFASTYLQDVLTCGDLLAEKSYISYRLWQVKNEEDPKTLRLLKEICLHYGQPLPKRFEGSISLASQRYLSFDSAFVWPSLQDPFLSDQGRCHGLLDMIAILSSGDVVPCCLDAHGGEVLGNIWTESLETILEKPHTLALQEEMRKGKMLSPLCQRCSYRLRFTKKKDETGIS